MLRRMLRRMLRQICLAVVMGFAVNVSSAALALDETGTTEEPWDAVVGDQYVTSVASSQSLMGIHRTLYLAQDHVLPPVVWEEDTAGRIVAGVLYRLSKGILVDNVLDHLVFLAQHEVFGHGARYRELGYVDNSFHLDLFFPYGDSHGYARIGSATRAVTDLEIVLRIAGGNEATTVLAHAFRNRWLLERSVHYRDRFLYVASACNLPLYVLGTYAGILGGPSNDISQYLSLVDETETARAAPPIPLERLAAYSLISFADPFLYASLWSYGRYIVTGHAYARMPMLRMGMVEYLPAFNLGLSPFGPEFIMHNYVRSARRLWEATVRVGDPTYSTFFGGSLRVDPVLLGLSIGDVPVLLDGEVSLWYQPVLPIPDDHPILLAGIGDGGLGGLIAIATDVAVLPRCGLTVQLVAKTDGFVPGEPLRGGLYLRAGLSFRAMEGPP
jgi:hypothetical protein